jgi:hypothetical protein
MGMANEAIGLFCEDIREEKQGTDTLIGVMPDNMVLPSPFPIFLAKLALYVRLNLSSESTTESIIVSMRFPNGNVAQIANFDTAAIQKAKLEAVGKPWAGLIAKVIFGGVQIGQDGNFEALVIFDGETSVCGFLSVKQQRLLPPSPSPTASLPPS